MPKRKTRRRLAYACTAMLGLIVLRVVGGDISTEQVQAITILAPSLMGILGTFITLERFSDKDHKDA